jgi:serine/threonine-protein kinase RsbW
MPDISQDTIVTGLNEPQKVSLVIPSKPEYVGLCRLVVGAIGARQALDEESIADLKLVVTEACICFLRGSKGGLPEESDEDSASPSIGLELAVEPETWQIVVSDPDHKHSIADLMACDALSDRGLGLTIIGALVDSMERIETESEGSIIRLVKRFPSSAGSDI